MGSYGQTMPSNGQIQNPPISNGLHAGRTDTDKEEDKQTFPGNGEESNQSQPSPEQTEATKENPHDRTSAQTTESPAETGSNVVATKRRHNLRSASESECDRLSPPNLQNLNPNDVHIGDHSPTNKPDYEKLLDELDDLPFPDEVKLPVPPDGGWGWVIVAASFVCCAVVDGLCSVFGVLLPDLVDYFEESSSKVSLAGSILAGGFLLSGPVASVAINCLGCRCTTIIGAVVSAVAMITCTFSSSVTVFILLFGGLGGLGLGLIYLPASVMVGYYFERRRGLAAGIASAGAGVGMVILSMLAAYLVQEYGWKGCLFVMAGICLQCLVCGALMRPLVPTLSVLKPGAFLEEESEEVPEKAAKKVKPVQTKFSPNLEVIKENVPLASPVVIQADSADVATANSQSSAEISKPRLSLPGDDSASNAKQLGPINRRILGVGSMVELAQKRDNSITSNKPINAAKRRRVSQERIETAGHDYHSCQELSYGKKNDSMLGLPFRRSGSISTESTVTPLMKKDVFYSGSIASLQNSMSRGDKEAESGIMSLSELYHPVAFEQKGIVSRAVHILKEMLDVSVLFNRSFLVICCANVLIQLAYFIPIVFLPAYGRSLGLTPSQAAMLLAVAGLSTLIGRACAGALASLRCVNGLHLNCLSTISAGVVTMFVVVCTTFKLLMTYGAIFGICVSGFVPMTTIFLVKYIGLDKLTNSFGLLSMIKGIATMAGPPIAGALLDMTNSYALTFYFSGAMFICSGLVFYLLPLSQKPVRLAYECAPFYCSTKDDAPTTDLNDEFIEREVKV